MTDRPVEGAAAPVTNAVLAYMLREMDKKVERILDDHDALVRMQVQVEHNQKDISRLAIKGREKDKSRRLESLAEMLVATVIGAGIGIWSP